MLKENLFIIGGGASGFTASIFAKRKNPNLNITIFEKNKRVLKKVLTTGNGRCNITNKNLSFNKYNREAEKFIKYAINSFGVPEAQKFFASIGILFSEENGGKIFPMNKQASSVVDMLLAEAEHLGINIKCESEITNIKKKGSFFEIDINSERLKSDKIIVSCGSKSGGGFSSGYEILKNFGHTITPLFPAVVQVKALGTKPLIGMKFVGKASVLKSKKIIEESEGEILFTDYGLSGPPIMNLSRVISKFFAEKKNLKEDIFISLDFLTEFTEGEIYSFLLERRKILGHLNAELFLNGVINKKISFEIMKRANLKLSFPVSSISNSDLKTISYLLKNFDFKAEGVMPFINSQVCAGGVELSQIEPCTMESKKVNGLFVTGEILNVDGICGGYNLHWAWASGHLAGKSV